MFNFILFYSRQYFIFNVYLVGTLTVSGTEFWNVHIITNCMIWFSLWMFFILCTFVCSKSWKDLNGTLLFADFLPSVICSQLCLSKSVYQKRIMEKPSCALPYFFTRRLNDSLDFLCLLFNSVYQQNSVLPYISLNRIDKCFKQIFCIYVYLR